MKQWRSDVHAAWRIAKKIPSGSGRGCRDELEEL